MSFLINISELGKNDVEYERLVIYAVVEMNKIYAKQNDFYHTCLNCMGIQYIDTQNQDEYLEIDHISAILDKGWAKCDSLVAWFMAIKELNGYITEPVFVPTDGRYHVKMKYKLASSKTDKDWKQIDPAQIIKKDCRSCQLL